MEVFEKNYDFKKVKNSAYKKYQSAGIYDLSDLDWLLACSLNKNRTELKLVQYISLKEYNRIKRAIKKRLQYIPVSKIFHSANFYGLDFFVNKNVLSPRNETEILVEEALKMLSNIRNPRVLDLCSGSGIIGITVKKKNPEAVVTCLDISKKALYVAKKNAKKNNVDIKFVKSNMFELLKKNLAYDMIISNPPYIKTSDLEKLADEVKYNDPIISLNGGKNGLDFYKNIANNAYKYLKPEGYVLVEIGFNQAKQVSKLFQNDYENIKVLNDYSGKQRVIIAKTKRINNDWKNKKN